MRCRNCDNELDALDLREGECPKCGTDFDAPTDSELAVIEYLEKRYPGKRFVNYVDDNVGIRQIVEYADDHELGQIWLKACRIEVWDATEGGSEMPADPSLLKLEPALGHTVLWRENGMGEFLGEEGRL